MNELAWMMRFSQYTEIHDEDADAAIILTLLRNFVHSFANNQTLRVVVYLAWC
jgi:hypothetical protein